MPLFAVALLAMVVGQQMAGPNGRAEIGFVPFKADNPYYANAYSFNVVKIPITPSLCGQYPCSGGR